MTAPDDVLVSWHTMETEPHRVVIALDWPTSPRKVISFVQSIILACTNNTWLPNPNTVLAAVSAALAVVVPLQTVAATRATGAADTRDVAIGKLKTAVEGLENQVQAVADLNPLEAVAIIRSCGFKPRATPVVHPTVSKAKPLSVAGSAQLMVAAVIGAICYFWQMSLDNRTWSDITPTRNRKTTVTGLASGTMYYFRFRVLLDSGYGEWSASFIVHID